MMNSFEDNHIKRFIATTKGGRPSGIIEGLFKPSWKTLRETYETGLYLGFHEGVRFAFEEYLNSLIVNNAEENDGGFYHEFVKLCVKHNRAITYHPQLGMKTTRLRDYDIIETPIGARIKPNRPK